MKKLLLFWIVLALLLGCLPPAVGAETVTGVCGNNLNWVFDRDAGTLTISGTGAMQDNPIWNNVSGDVKTVKIGEGVTSIGESAFREFYALTKVEFPDRMERIGASAFSACTSLKEIRLPDGITELPDNLFWHAQALKQVTLPESLTRIGAAAFEACFALKSLTIPAGVRAVGARAFAQVSTLTLTFSGDAPSFDATAFADGMNVNASYPSAAKGWTELAGERFGASSLMWSSDGTPTQTAPLRDSPKDASLPLEPEITANGSRQDFSGNYARTVASHLLDNGDGTFTRVEYSNYKVHVEVYDASYRLIWKQQLERELPIWGGFYGGKNYNFLVFGQNNSKEDNNCEVVRVVRYSKNWHRLDSAGVYGCNTTEPFRAGSLRMVEWGDYLYIHTAHQRYATPDGLRHQSDMNLRLLIPEMKLEGGEGSCSHSFDQFIIEDAGAIVRLNLGDARPRAVVINSTSVLKIPGEKGDNYTGTALGAFLASAKNYLTAGVTLVNWQTNKYGKVKNLFLGVTDKETHSTTLRKITDYGENKGITRPHMIKVGDDRFLLLWVEHSGEVAWDGVSAARQLRYVFLDGDGNSVSQIYTSPYVLSDCVPILTGNRVLWYVTDNALPLFCWIDLDAPEKVHTNGPDVLPERITVTPQNLTLTPGQSVQLAASVEPAGADAQLIWTSSDPSVVTVDQNGRVTGVSAEKDKALTANINVRHLYGGPYAYCYIFMKYDPAGRFVDVPDKAYYQQAVSWAVENGVTNGTDDSHFSPEQSCTRAQAVTFLWRAAGQPEPAAEANPFTDVKLSDYFYKAVLWALQNGVTTGTTAAAFSPQAKCTRAQIVTFLYRAAKEPPVSGKLPFADVGKAYYTNAVKWAVANGITTGTSAVAFSPDAVCTRAQIVTFLYRASALNRASVG